ncbi:hypothetical protein U1Q18_002903 [Sarracenia purpurea var. burkii]
MPGIRFWEIAEIRNINLDARGLHHGHRRCWPGSRFPSFDDDVKVVLSTPGNGTHRPCDVRHGKYASREGAKRSLKSNEDEMIYREQLRPAKRNPRFLH